MRLGFLGTGSITESIVNGLLRSGYEFSRIMLSPRNQERAKRLAALDKRIHVAEDNQEVIDASTVVCLAVLPQNAEAILGSLRFHAGHHVISFIATYSAGRLSELLRGNPTIVRAVPVPTVEDLKGPTGICPPDAIARQLFASLGLALETDKDAHYDALCAFAGVMETFYALLDEQVDWLCQQGIEYGQAKAYVTQMYVGLAEVANKDARTLKDLAADFGTEGGLNQQMHRDLSAAGVFATFRGALENLSRRIRKTH